MARTDLYTSIGPSLSALVRTQLDRLISQGYRPLPCWIGRDGEPGPAIATARRALLAYEPEDDATAIRKVRLVGEGAYPSEDVARLRPVPDAGPLDIPEYRDIPEDAIIAISTRSGWAERTAETVGALVYHALLDAHRAAVAEASRLLGYALDPATGYPEGYEPPAPSDPPKAMTPSEFKARRLTAGLTQADLGRRWAVSARTIRRLESDPQWLHRSPAYADAVRYVAEHVEAPRYETRTGPRTTN